MARTKTVFEWDFDDQPEFKKTLPEMIEWLQSMIDGAPCDANAIELGIYQVVDHWDGCSPATFEITRPMTPEEEAEQDRRHAELQMQRDAQTEASERALLARLSQKYATE